MEIHLARPNVTEHEINAVTAVLRTPQLALGPKLPEFEERFADYLGCKHAVAVSSGTAGLHLVVRSMGIGSGDEVITTPFSFVASANCALFEGAKIAFADVDPETWNIDPAKIESAINSRTRAVIPVDVFGQTPDMDRIEALAKKHDLRVIEDSCEALGAKFNGRPAGTFGDAGVFGFYPNKQMTTGEGGMVTTDDEEIASLCRSMRNQGRDTNGGWLAHPRMGYNYRLCDINCALGIAQLDRIDEILSERRRVAALYLERLSDERRLTIQRRIEGLEPSWFVMVVRLTDDYGEGVRDEILVKLRERGIGCSNYFVPIHLQHYFREQYGFREGDFPICEALAARTIALPFHHELGEADVDRVCSELRKLL
jgi:perosamine synthetase